MDTEFKFRAWDKRSNRFVDSGIQFNNTTMRLATISDLILMRYTGLKDKNGKEIYEGDIVSSGKWVAQVIYGIYGFTITPNLTKQRNEVVLVNLNIILEVIGNIYENPELKGAVR